MEILRNVMYVQPYLFVPIMQTMTNNNNGYVIYLFIILKKIYAITKLKYVLLKYNNNLKEKLTLHFL